MDQLLRIFIIVVIAEIRAYQSRHQQSLAAVQSPLNGNITYGNIAMRSLLNSLVVDERGVTAIEYGVLAAMVAFAGMAAFTRLGTAISGEFDKISTALNGITVNKP